MFYTKGKAIEDNSVVQIVDLSRTRQIYIAIKTSQLSRISTEMISLKMIGDAGSYRLYLSK